RRRRPRRGDARHGHRPARHGRRPRRRRVAPGAAGGPAVTAGAGSRAHEDGPYFGQFGGRFVPEALVAALDELDAAWKATRQDPEFIAELSRLHRSYTGRPSIITEVPRFAEHAGGARIVLKREDLNHTGSH